MATFSTAAANAALNAIVDLLDAGTAETYPYVQFETSGGVEVAKCDLTDTTAFGAAASGEVSAGTIADDDDADGGAIDRVVLYDQDNTEVFRGVPSTAADQDFQIGSLTVGPGDTIGISSITLTFSS